MGLKVNTARACRVVSISYRQLDYWLNSGLISIDKNNGKQRELSFSDLLQLKVIKKLLDRGVSLQRIRAGIDFLKNELCFDKPLVDATLITDGQDIFAICREDKEIINILKQGQAVFGIALGDVYSELEGDLMRIYPSFDFPSLSKMDSSGQAVKRAIKG